MVKNHHYSHERESEGAYYLHFLLITVFLLMEFWVVVCVYGGGGVRLTAGRGLSARVQGGRYRPEVESERKRTFLWS